MPGKIPFFTLPSWKKDRGETKEHMEQALWIKKSSLRRKTTLLLITNKYAPVFKTRNQKLGSGGTDTSIIAVMAVIPPSHPLGKFSFPESTAC